jgi:hypothetical protein
MAHALEAFLIDSMRPERNAIGQRWAVNGAHNSAVHRTGARVARSGR